ncbi:hypothetical protein Fleli_1457 [Bernardetia litoralis DSM 6794]|uniref:Uncharacterized protein n=1 Tax=Bernardetia litoralis (strain ATCC 23117 / DSM 6794 / NBRC 15988 / NCIMB 1366 / Fx l1 / Sio-4) TaxID=880071 RepID=I4AIU8_BERLS|nr:hypothetical protein [Bernardetia litoralis]AFM03883.1 hypothetical protein Fleli_1457 [Bernardetia litoralis DSM 6794]
MIANKPVQHSISLIHFTIGILCLSTFGLYLSSEAKWALSSLIGKKESFFIILLGIIGLFSFFGALSWQTTASKTSKTISYLISLLFLLEYITILFISSNSKEYVIGLLPTVTPAVFLFLVAYSKINQFQENGGGVEYNDYLDSDFLINEEKKYIPTFLKPNRIVSFILFLFSVLLFLVFTSSGAPFWTIIIPSIFLVFCIILWLLPKIGSWIFSIMSILTSISVIGLFIFLMLTKPFNDGVNKIHMISFFSLLVLSIASFGWGLAMLLLSKEAQQEWKK